MRPCRGRQRSPVGVRARRGTPKRTVAALFGAGIELGGAISGEHGVGTEKKQYFFEFEDPVKISLMRRIKHAFDPNGILGPGVIFDEIDDLRPKQVTG